MPRCGVAVEEAVYVVGGCVVVDGAPQGDDLGRGGVVHLAQVAPGSRVVGPGSRSQLILSFLVNWEPQKDFRQLLVVLTRKFL